MFETLMGPNVVTKMLFFIAALIVTAEFVATVFTIFYQRYIYDRYMRPKFSDSYNPRCTVIVPCKGVPKDLGRNLMGFLELEYNNYEVIFVVEKESDKAVPYIKAITEKDKRAKLVVAGLSTRCAQKNHNMIAGLRKADESNVYVFADSDIKPDPTWLKELILPLADEKVTVTSGFRWLNPPEGSLGELTHSYVNIFIYVSFSAACFFGGVGLWGGSMAIRKKDFDELGVEEKWSKAAVDDMSLSHLVFKGSKKAVVVPSCITQTDDLLKTVGGSVSWFERQIMFLKAYQRKLWFFPTLPMAVSVLILIFLLPVALLGSVLSPSYSFTDLGGGAALVFYLGQALSATLYPFLGKMTRFYKFILFQPFMRLTHIISYFRTFMTNTIVWSGIRYNLSKSGDVDSLEHIAQESNI
ncbi:glycosyltransferase family 2 protein [Chitinispirillales bacterium ANBcel5]|uniref:glycosyltransferase n=1 Tax=Cellulosispirillum alkaliphilum TaxID=3039283 RepID=UPI002A513A01|nr:glycosyltransferase family 2 protein [Chitinispirillales bacterium ANBcel5]